MTVKENISLAIMLQIFFWDLVINLMSAIQKIRQKIVRPTTNSNIKNNQITTAIIILACVALGLYIGILLGYFGI